MAYLHALECCGIQELANIGDNDNLDGLLMEIRNRLTYDLNGSGGVKYGFETGAVVFTEAGRGNDYGRRLAKEIVKNKLGTVTAAPVYTNPNTSRAIRAFIWSFNKTALSAYLVKLDKPKKKTKITPFKWK